MLSLHRRIRVTQGRDVVFLSSPVISSGRVFVAYPEEGLICLDAGTLTELWRTPAERFEIWGALGGRLLMQSRQRLRAYSTDGSLVWDREFEPDGVYRWRDSLVALSPTPRLIDAETGRDDRALHWQIDPWASAQFVGDLLITMAGQRGPRWRIEDPVTAYEFDTGKVRWRKSLHAELQERWSFGSRDWPVFLPGAPGERPLLAYARQTMVAISSEDGHVHWVVPYFGGEAPPVRLGQLLVGLAWEETRRHFLRCVDTETGGVVYEVALGDFDPELRGFLGVWRPVGFGSKLVFSTRCGWLLLIDRSSGRIESAQRLKSELMPPVADDARVYVLTGSGELLVFESREVPEGGEVGTPARLRGPATSPTTLTPDVRITRAEAETLAGGELGLGHAVIDELWGYLQDWEANKDLLEKVTPGQRLLTVAYHALNEVGLVANLEEFLSSDAGEIADEAAGALGALGFAPVARRLRAALAVFEEGLPATAAERLRVLGTIDAKRKRVLFGAAEEAMGDLASDDCFLLACARYVESHPADFFKPESPPADRAPTPERPLRCCGSGYSSDVPEVSRFLGVVIAMFYSDHNPPHFHAYYGDQEAAVAIADGRLLWGTLPRRALGHVQEWRQAHVAELEADWARARAREPLLPIEPLE